ncbi:MAG: TetR/AcrR family transcriptional regulator [Candidatus Dormiibacterota bacterium]
MSRTVNLAEQTVRRDAFIDVAQHLIQTKAYEQMSVQDILDGVGASRGAFYHYFDSKQQLLDAVVTRMGEAAIASLDSTVRDPSLSALAKLQRVFSGIAGWKAERRDLVLGIAEIWLSDDNALVREKLRQRMMQDLAPVLGSIIAQGKSEGVFAVSAPRDAALVLVSLMFGANLLATELFIGRRSNRVTLEEVERLLGAYAEAYERVLGVREGSLRIDGELIRLWYQ